MDKFFCSSQYLGPKDISKLTNSIVSRGRIILLFVLVLLKFMCGGWREFLWGLLQSRILNNFFREKGRLFIPVFIINFVSGDYGDLRV